MPVDSRLLTVCLTISGVCGLAACGADGTDAPAAGGTTAASPSSGGRVAATGGVAASSGVATTGGVGAGGAGRAAGSTAGSSGTAAATGGNGDSASGGMAATGGRSELGGSGGTGSGGGQGGTADVGGGGSGATPMCQAIPSTSTRPQLTSTEAAEHTIANYLGQSDHWDPTAGLGDPSSFKPDFTVAADGSGTHTTVQAAVTAAASGSARRYILIKPGTYRGSVSLVGSTPITLYGSDLDASRVVIVDNKSAGSAGGTGGSATFTAKANGFQAMNLTISNDFATPTSGTNIQAVALYTTGDKVVLQNVRLHGFQDTLFTDSGSSSVPSRVYAKNCFIEGDTDFIFGAASLVIDASTIKYLSSRKTGGACLAPSTRVGNEHGFLVIDSAFTSDSASLSNNVSLGRSWDQGGVTPTPNGEAVLRNTTIAAHIRKANPWAAGATTGRAYSASGNRFYEYCNSGPGASP
jgi:pectinesterase